MLTLKSSSAYRDRPSQHAVHRLDRTLGFWRAHAERGADALDEGRAVRAQ